MAHAIVSEFNNVMKALARSLLANPAASNYSWPAAQPFAQIIALRNVSAMHARCNIPCAAKGGVNLATPNAEILKVILCLWDINITANTVEYLVPSWLGIDHRFCDMAARLSFSGASWLSCAHLRLFSPEQT